MRFVRWVVAAGLAVGWTGIVISWFLLTAHAGNLACHGTWFSYVIAPLLWLVGLPLLAAPLSMAEESVGRRVAFGFGVLVMVGLLSLWFPLTYPVGVCVAERSVTRWTLVGRTDIDLALVTTARRERGTTADTFVLGEVVIPLRADLGQGRARDPDALATALLAAGQRAGLVEEPPKPLPTPEELRRKLDPLSPD